MSKGFASINHSSLRLNSDIKESIKDSIIEDSSSINNLASLNDQISKPGHCLFS